jgi:hypothetical protein
MSMPISPSPGRVVWFVLVSPMSGFAGSAGAVLPALVAHVHNDRLINIAVFDANGRPYPDGMQNVRLVQPGDDAPSGNYCTWMPYQVGQARKQEAAERQAFEGDAALSGGIIGAAMAAGAPLTLVQGAGQQLVADQVGGVEGGPADQQQTATPLKDEASANAALEDVGQEAAADLSRDPPAENQAHTISSTPDAG